MLVLGSLWANSITIETQYDEKKKDKKHNRSNAYHAPISPVKCVWSSRFRSSSRTKLSSYAVTSLRSRLAPSLHRAGRKQFHCRPKYHCFHRNSNQICVPKKWTKSTDETTSQWQSSRRCSKMVVSFGWQDDVTKKTVEQNSSARVVYVMADPFFALSDILLVGTASPGWSELHFCLKPSLSPKITFVPKNFG